MGAETLIKGRGLDRNNAIKDSLTCASYGTCLGRDDDLQSHGGGSSGRRDGVG